MNDPVALSEICSGDRFRIDDGETIVMLTTIWHEEGPDVTITYRPVNDPRIVNERKIDDVNKVKFTRAKT